MKSRFMTIVLVVLASNFCAVHTIAIPRHQASSTADRAASEKAIRVALYEIAFAALTGNTKAFKQRAAKRTLGLYDLVFAELSANPKSNEQFRKLGVTNGAGFLDFGFRAVANRSAAAPRSKLEELAREQSGSPLTFVSDKEATAQNNNGVFKAVLEDNDWKIDMTEALKKSLLQTLPFTSESKEKIEKY